MRDKSGAHHVAPDGSRLGIMPTTSGGIATTPRAPGQDRPRTVPPGTARPDRLRATLRAPDQDVPRTLAVRAPGSDRPCATLRAPGADVPPATTAGAPGQDRLRAAQRAQDHCRSRPGAPTAPGQDRPLAAPSGVAWPDRPCATLRAPDQNVPRTLAVRAPGSDRPRAVAATAAAADESHVSPLAAGSDSSHRGSAAGPPPTSLTTHTTPAHDLYGQAYSAEEVQQPTPADRTPLFATAVRLLLALVLHAQALDIAHALDVLRRQLQDRPALTPVAEHTLLQSLEAAAMCTDTPPRPADPSTEPGAPPTDRPPFKPP